MDYRKKYWKFTSYLHPCRVQCLGVLVLVFSVRMTETGVLSMQAHYLQKCLPSDISVIFCPPPSVPEPGVTIGNGADLLTNRVYTFKWAAQSNHSAWSNTRFSPLTAPPAVHCSPPLLNLPSKGPEHSFCSSHDGFIFWRWISFLLRIKRLSEPWVINKGGTQINYWYYFGSKNEAWL